MLIIIHGAQIGGREGVSVGVQSSADDNGRLQWVSLCAERPATACGCFGLKWLQEAKNRCCFTRVNTQH